MAFRGKKVYGESKVQGCPFCGQQSTTRNWQGVPTCKAHKEEELPNLKCVCGEYLDVRVGKFGPYFSCLKCGNVNFNKGLDYNGMSVGNLKKNTDGQGSIYKEKSNGSNTEDINERIRKEIEAALRGD